MSRRATDTALLSCLFLWASPGSAELRDVITREDWAARPPALAMQEHVPHMITIHHTATPQKPDRRIEEKLRSLQAFSQSKELLADGRQKKAWADVPYHFYVDASGQIAEGRDVRFIGDTNTNYDPTGHIAVVLEGNFEIENPSETQLKALSRLLEELIQQHSIEPTAISMHNEHASTLCPGRNLAQKLPEILTILSTSPKIGQ